MRHLAQRLARHVLTLLTGVSVDGLIDDIDRAHTRIGELQRENATLRKQMQPAAGTVMRWRDGGLS